MRDYDVSTMQRLEVLKELIIGLVVAYGGGTGFELLFEIAFGARVDHDGQIYCGVLQSAAHCAIFSL